MARIFISHAHADRHLATKLVTLLKNALGLRGAQDVFCSSREGAGVTPGAEIREEVVQHLKSASALIVLLTPKSVGSPWVWFEAGARMAVDTHADPLFAVPADRFKTLPAVIADRRGVSLDNPTEVHALVAEVARQLNTSADLPGYDADVAELTASARRTYSRFNEARLNLARWTRAHALLLLILGIAVASALAVRTVQARSASAQKVKDEATVEANQNKRQAGQFLKWQGQLLSSGLPPTGDHGAVNEPCSEGTERRPGQTPIRKAVVLAWKPGSQVKADLASCLEPQCTSDTTFDDGKFEIYLNKIGVNNGDSIALLVKPPQGEWVSCQLNINVNTSGKTSPAASQLQLLTVTPAAGGSAGPTGGLH